MAVIDANCLVMSLQFSGLENDCVTFLQLVKAVKLLAGGATERIFYLDFACRTEFSSPF